MDTIIVGLFILNNIVWMMFFYLHTGTTERKTIPLPNIIKPTPPEAKRKDAVVPPDLGEVTDVNLQDALVGMGMKDKEDNG